MPFCSFGAAHLYITKCFNRHVFQQNVATVAFDHIENFRILGGDKSKTPLLERKWYFIPDFRSQLALYDVLLLPNYQNTS